MNIKCVLAIFISLALVSALVYSSKANDGYIDALVEPIDIIVHAPMEVIVGEDFNITVGVQASHDLTLDDLSIEVKDTYHVTVHEETLFTSLYVPSYKTPIEETVTTSLSLEGKYYIVVDFTYTVDSEKRTFNIIQGKIGFVRDVSYDDLNTEYDSLNSNYSALETQYLILQKHHDSVSNQMDFFRLLSVVMLIATAVLTITTIYYARKPKAKALDKQIR